MVYLILIDSDNNATFGGVFATMDDAFAHGDKSESDDFNTITNFDELTAVQQISVYNHIASKHKELNIEQVTQFGSKVQATDRIMHAISKMSPEQLDAFAAAKPKKQRKPKGERKPRVVSGTITLAHAANSDDKIWRKESLRAKALSWVKNNLSADNQSVALSDAINGIAAENNISTAQARGLLDKLRGVNAIKVDK